MICCIFSPVKLLWLPSFIPNIFFFKSLLKVSQFANLSTHNTHVEDAMLKNKINKHVSPREIFSIESFGSLCATGTNSHPKNRWLRNAWTNYGTRLYFMIHLRQKYRTKNMRKSIYAASHRRLTTAKLKIGQSRQIKKSFSYCKGGTNEQSRKHAH